AAPDADQRELVALRVRRAGARLITRVRIANRLRATGAEHDLVDPWVEELCERDLGHRAVHVTHPVLARTETALAERIVRLIDEGVGLDEREAERLALPGADDVRSVGVGLGAAVRRRLVGRRRSATVHVPVWTERAGASARDLQRHDAIRVQPARSDRLAPDVSHLNHVRADAAEAVCGS